MNLFAKLHGNKNLRSRVEGDN